MFPWFLRLTERYAPLVFFETLKKCRLNITGERALFFSMVLAHKQILQFWRRKCHFVWPEKYTDFNVSTTDRAIVRCPSEAIRLRKLASWFIAKKFVKIMNPVKYRWFCKIWWGFCLQNLDILTSVVLFIWSKFRFRRRHSEKNLQVRCHEIVMTLHFIKTVVYRNISLEISICCRPLIHRLMKHVPLNQRSVFYTKKKNSVKILRRIEWCTVYISSRICAIKLDEFVYMVPQQRHKIMIITVKRRSVHSLTKPCPSQSFIFHLQIKRLTER